MKKKALSILLASVLVSAFLAGCGSSSASSNKSADTSVAMAEEPAYDYAYDMDAEEAYEATDDVYEYSKSTGSAAGSNSEGEAVSDSEIQSNSNRKLIKTVNMTAETREFDELIANVTERIVSLGGYAESTDIQGNSYNSTSERRAFIVARIPASKLDFFVKGIEDESNITSKNESAEDVTLQYADVEAHKDSLKIEQERLNELLEKADTLENIIELENRLTEVRYEIESYESRLRTMNNLVVYATVNLTVQEVKEYTPEPVEEQTFGQRIAEGFLDSCENAWELIQDFIVGFVSILPTLIVLLIILAIIFFIIFGIVKAIIAVTKKSAGKKARKRADMQAKAAPTAKALPNPPAAPSNAKPDEEKKQ